MGHEQALLLSVLVTHEGQQGEMCRGELERRERDSKTDITHTHTHSLVGKVVGCEIMGVRDCHFPVPFLWMACWWSQLVVQFKAYESDIRQYDAVEKHKIQCFFVFLSFTWFFFLLCWKEFLLAVDYIKKEKKISSTWLYWPALLSKPLPFLLLCFHINEDLFDWLSMLVWFKLKHFATVF